MTLRTVRGISTSIRCRKSTVRLLRTGESLREMSDSEMLKILTEQEPDYSAKVCEGLTMDDLDPKAIEVMKQKYAEKNENPGFESVSDEQALSDLDLLEDGKLNYAALVLLGKQKAIRKYMPQNNVVIEYRNDPASIQYDARIEIQQPLFLAVEEIWAFINQPTLNPQVQREGTGKGTKYKVVKMMDDIEL